LTRGRGIAFLLIMKRTVQGMTDELQHAITNPSADLNVLRRLIEQGADPNGMVRITKEVGRDFLGDMETVDVQVSVIELAAEAGQRSVVRLLIAAGGEAGPSVRKMYTGILRGALASTDPKAVQSALEEAELAGVPVESVDLADLNPAILPMVLERRWRLHPESAAPEGRRTELTACLLRAVRHPGEEETIRYLLAHGADADFFDPGPRGEQAVSPLHAALRSGFNPGPIRLLLEHGARTTYVFEDGHRETARELVSARLHPADFSFLVGILHDFEEQGAQTSALDLDGGSLVAAEPAVAADESPSLAPLGRGTRR
jgi:hypothetical protein